MKWFLRTLALAVMFAARASNAGEPAKPKVAESQKAAPPPPETLTDAEALAFENLRLRLQLLTQQVMMAHGLGPDDKVAPDGRTIIRAPKPARK